MSAVDTVAACKAKCAAKYCKEFPSGQASVSNTNRIGASLNYSLDYAYYPGTHKAERIGNKYYDYDLNGNVKAEREGGHAVSPEIYRPYYQEGNLYWTDYAFGMVKPEGNKPVDNTYQRNYKWNERNLLSESSDSAYTVQYRYGADGERALKFTANSGRATVYFNKMWQMSDAAGGWLQSKHIYVNDVRIATKYNSEGNNNTGAEKERIYYYHSDHLGSAQTVTNYRGQVHERLEYTPYGELWIDWKGATAPEDGTPFRFTGKEIDPETGLYYYGARYLDPKTSRWMSGDPAMGKYLPDPGQGADKLPGMGGVYNIINLHSFGYAGNNPVKYTDPDGEFAWLAVPIVIGVITLLQSDSVRTINPVDRSAVLSQMNSRSNLYYDGQPKGKTISSVNSNLKDDSIVLHRTPVAAVGQSMPAGTPDPSDYNKDGYGADAIMKTNIIDAKIGGAGLAKTMAENMTDGQGHIFGDIRLQFTKDRGNLTSWSIIETTKNGFSGKLENSFFTKEQALHFLTVNKDLFNETQFREIRDKLGLD